ncbi:integral inner membrane protein [Gracilibacillus halophilus YIM-C55.5]|uniref:Integral inner membrane protein n=1 Tax=Gracilibacillus halophilus YIM-C55.5 TaxID=1308866 RepID=N4WCX7_9BACI|nr:sporulation membrane protein YtaF [Gracilibacillus halophilus]ENH97064.1 integral inner membrane protein [Gracilibacillus halophilus YIM-C55.5]
MLWFVAVAISLDSLFVAFTYGLRNVQLPWKEVMKIAVTVGAVFGLAMVSGSMISMVIPLEYLERISGLLLLIIGFLLVVSCLIKQNKPSNHRLSTLINIMKKPVSADFDQSGEINGMEAVWIGIALSLDSIGAGISLSFIASPILFTSFFVCLITGCFLIIGVSLGKSCAYIKGVQRMSLLPGCLLMLIGVWKIIIV